MAKRTAKSFGSTFIQNSRARPSSEKALYHDITGAGKSHVKRPFFSLTPADEEALTAALDTHLAQVVKRA